MNTCSSPFNVQWLGVRSITKKITTFHLSSDWANCVRSCLSLITKRRSRLNSFDVRKNDIGVFSMSNLVNLVICLLGLMSFRSKPKIGCWSSIVHQWTCSSLFDVQKMKFKFVRRSIKWCSTHHYVFQTTVYCR